MKKRIISSLLLLVAVLTPLYASITDLDVTEKRGTNTEGRPRSSSPSVNASAQGDELTIDINRYLGNAQVTVVAEDGSSTTCNTYYINGHTSFAMDFTGYNEGHYSITITLQGGQIYSGSFRME